MRNAVLGLSSFVVLVLANGCGGGGGGTTAPPGPLASVIVSGSSTLVVNGTTQLSVTGKDANGTTLTTLPAAAWTSSNTAVATVNASTGLVTGVAVGSANITATVSGMASAPKAISVIVPPTSASVVANTSLEFVPPDVDIAAGGTVTWTFQSVTHDVTFNGTAAGTPTNLGQQTNTSVSRTFTTPGTFAYHCSIHPGMNGTVVVH